MSIGTDANVLTTKAMNNTAEADLIFPRRGGLYPTTGIPIVVGIQNPAAAFEYGWKVSWDLWLEPRQYDFGFGDYWGYLGASIGAGVPENVTSGEGEQGMYFGVDNTGSLKPGNYTLEWHFYVQPWCDFEQGSTWAISWDIAQGSLEFTVEDGIAQPQLQVGDGAGNGNDESCASLMGVVSYVSTTSYTFAATTDTLIDSTPVFFPETSSACVVTASPTLTPNPCAATLDTSVEANILSIMQWTASSTVASGSGPAASQTSAASTGSSASTGVPGSSTSSSGALDIRRFYSNQWKTTGVLCLLFLLL
ncbi:hypothetical protein F5Y15DRAFT_416235 [Xylariaceae sp. FL0016]|nr:hypothetical protein F5Y15DRAFT_416235 [Xylariaceae sp. FL0016]